jgi:hypothetical protein
MAPTIPPTTAPTGARATPTADHPRNQKAPSYPPDRSPAAPTNNPATTVAPAPTVALRANSPFHPFGGSATRRSDAPHADATPVLPKR